MTAEKQKTSLVVSNKSISRDVGIDLLRIIAMLMICMLHTLKYGGIFTAQFKSGKTYWMAWVLEIACFCAVNIYALISGYVGYNKKHRYSSLLNICFIVVFYSVSISLIFYFSPYEMIDLKGVLRSAFPIYTEQYWYFNAYFIMFFFLPIINKGLSAISEKQHLWLVVTLFTVFSVLNFFSYIVDGYTSVWLIILYIFGTYLKRSNIQSKNKSRKKWFFLYLSATIFTIASKFVLSITPFARHQNILIEYTSPTIVIAALGVFMLFCGKQFSPFARKVIGFLSPLTFSVYIIHTTPLIKDNFFIGKFSFVTDYPFYTMALTTVGTALCIYLICSGIDIVRLYLFKLLRIKNLSEWIIKKITVIYGKILSAFITDSPDNRM